MKNSAFYESSHSLENSVSLKIMEFDQNSSLWPHWHENIELLFFRSGGCLFSINGDVHTVSEGDLVVINGLEIHSFTAAQVPNYVCLIIYPPFFSEIKISNILLKNHIQQDVYIKNCIDDILSEYSNSGIEREMMVKSHTYRLMAYLSHHYVEAFLSDKDINARSSTIQRMNLLHDYISKHYNEKITTEFLAELCYLSKSHFCHFFKNATGKTAVEYIKEYRIAKASKMLENTKDSITDIASAVGFDDVNYFSRTFKQVKKITPGAYRKNSL